MAVNKIIGKRVKIGKRVTFSGFKDKDLILIIGDDVRIEDDVRIIGGGNVILGNNVTLHNHVTIHGPGDCYIKRNTWIGQYTALDATGGLEIGESCCIGFNCQIWSHVRRAPYIPNMIFDKFAKTILEDRVWLQGGLITINPGVTIGHDCVIFSNSVVNKNTKSSRVYGGIPVKEIEKYTSPYKRKHE